MSELVGSPGEGAAQMQEGCTDWTSPYRFETPLLLPKKLGLSRSKDWTSRESGSPTCQEAWLQRCQ